MQDYLTEFKEALSREDQDRLFMTANGWFGGSEHAIPDICDEEEFELLKNSLIFAARTKSSKLLEVLIPKCVQYLGPVTVVECLINISDDV